MFAQGRGVSEAKNIASAIIVTPTAKALIERPIKNGSSIGAFIR